MKKAMFVRDLESWNGKLYKVVPSIEYLSFDKDGNKIIGSADYVIVNAVGSLFTGPQVLIFPAGEDGRIVSYLTIVNIGGTLDHEVALVSIEYILEEGEC